MTYNYFFEGYLVSCFERFFGCVLWLTSAGHEMNTQMLKIKLITIYCALGNTWTKTFICGLLSHWEVVFSVLHHCVAPWSPSLDPLIVVLDAAEDHDVISDLTRLEGGVAGAAITISYKALSKWIHKKTPPKNKQTKKTPNKPKYPTYNCIK